MHPYNTPFVVAINPLNCESQAKPVSMTGLLLTLCTKYKPMCGLYQWWHVVPFLWHTFPIVSCFGQAMLAKCLKYKCKCKARRETFSPQIGVSIVSSPGRCRLIVLCMRKKNRGTLSTQYQREYWPENSQVHRKGKRVSNQPWTRWSGAPFCAGGLWGSGSHLVCWTLKCQSWKEKNSWV